MPIQTSQTKLMTTREAAAYLGLSTDTVAQYVHRGIIAVAEKIGNMRMISQVELDRYRREKRPVGRPAESRDE